MVLVAKRRAGSEHDAVIGRELIREGERIDWQVVLDQREQASTRRRPREKRGTLLHPLAGSRKIPANDLGVPGHDALAMTHRELREGIVELPGAEGDVVPQAPASLNQ